MPGRRNGQKFRHTLDDAQNDGLEQIKQHARSGDSPQRLFA
jgi:hypothetical protein